MLEVQEFLRKHSTGYVAGDLHERSPELAYALLEELYHINVKRHGEYPNLVLLKYNQIDSPLGESIVQECRGLILDEDNDFNVVSMGYTKFFNHGEGHAAFINWDTARVWEKVDGSLITLYHYDGRWQVATSGTPDANTDVNGFDITFAELFWETLAAMGADVDAFEPGYSYMFELCAPENRVVVPHARRKLYLHGARRLDTLQEERPDVWSEQALVPMPCSWPLTSFEEVVAAAADLEPMEQEGYVVCDGAFSRVKVKSPRYVAIHHAKDSLSPRAIANLIRMGESSEFLSYFPQLVEVHDRIKEDYDKLLWRIASSWQLHQNIKDQKEFALRVKDLPYSGALFSLKAGKAKTPADYIQGLTEPAYHRLLGLRE